MGVLNASGIITNTHLSDPEAEWYETISTDEVIPFLDHEGILRNVNTITMFSNATILKLSACRIDNETDKTVLYESDKIYIGSGASLENGMINFNAIKVHGLSGQQIKYICNFY